MEQTATTTAVIASKTSQLSPAMLENLIAVTQNSIYLMGASFVLGSLFTLFMLLVLDFVRRGKNEKDYQ